MENLIRIQGRVIKQEPTKTGYYIIFRELKTGKRQGAFSKWKFKEGIYSLDLRQDNRYFFIVRWQALIIQETKEITLKQDIHQPCENKESQAERQLIQQLQAKIKQLQAENQQLKNAYYNQKWMLKEAQKNAYESTVQAKIKAIQSKPGKKSKHDLDYLRLLNDFSQECQDNWAWLNE